MDLSPEGSSPHRSLNQSVVECAQSNVPVPVAQIHGEQHPRNEQDEYWAMPVIYDAPPVTGETVRSPYEVIEQGIPLPALPLKKRKRGESANTQLKYALQQQLHSSQLVRDFHQITTNEDSGDELYDPEEDNYVEAGLVDSGEEPTKRVKRTYECQHCNQVFDSPQGYSSHQKKHKQRNLEDVEEKAEPVKGRPSPTHKGKVWTCAICSLEFPSQQGYASHQKKHKPKVNNPSKIWQCQHCLLTFNSSQGYASHQKKHKNRNVLQAEDVHSTSAGYEEERKVVHGIDVGEEDLRRIFTASIKEECPLPEQTTYNPTEMQSYDVQLRAQIQHLQSQVQQQKLQTQLVQDQLAQAQAQNTAFRQLLSILGPQIAAILSAEGTLDTAAEAPSHYQQSVPQDPRDYSQQYREAQSNLFPHFLASMAPSHNAKPNYY